MQIPIAARVQTTFFGLHMTQNNALFGQNPIAKIFMCSEFQVPLWLLVIQYTNRHKMAIFMNHKTLKILISIGILYSEPSKILCMYMLLAIALRILTHVSIYVNKVCKVQKQNSKKCQILKFKSS